jgi:hypothetical protein
LDYCLQKTAGCLSIQCSAKTAEVLLAESRGATATYECTVKGVPVENEKDLFTLEYTPLVNFENLICFVCSTSGMSREKKI